MHNTTKLLFGYVDLFIFFLASPLHCYSHFPSVRLHFLRITFAIPTYKNMLPSFWLGAVDDANPRAQKRKMSNFDIDIRALELKL